MPAAKDDATTDIESLVKDFAKDMTAEADKLRKARLEQQKKDEAAAKKEAEKAKADKKPADKKAAEKKVVPPPEVTFALSPTKESKSRTPAEQAELLVAGSTKVCWSAHMADKARHVLMKVDGKVAWEAKKAFGEDFEAFKKKWGEVMKKYGLKNAAGGDGWPTWDEFHLELPNAKVARTDERACACLDEYARLTRKEGKKQNADFEKTYAKLLKTFVEKYEKKDDKKNDQKEDKDKAKDKAPATATKKN